MRWGKNEPKTFRDSTRTHAAPRRRPDARGRPLPVPFAKRPESMCDLVIFRPPRRAPLRLIWPVDSASNPIVSGG